MTTVNQNYMTQSGQYGNVPFGNITGLPFNFTTDASGIFTNSDLATAVQSGDVVRLGIIPAGFQMQDMQLTISNAFSTSTTGSLGFQYVDGVDVAAAAQDAAYFVSAKATDATSVSRKTGVKAPITLPKDAYLILTVGGAAHAEVGVLDVIVLGVNTGGSGA